MAEFPNPKDLSAKEILTLAEKYFDWGDYGAAQYYSGFALGIASYALKLIKYGNPLAPPRDEIEDYQIKANKINFASNHNVKADLYQKLSGSNVKITDENLKVLLEEHSLHYRRLNELLEYLGKDYDCEELSKLF